MANKIYTGGRPFTGVGFANTNKGYDVVASRLSRERKEAALRHTNATLHDGSSFVNFFCSRVSIDLGLSGKTAQARYVRDFYAHNVEIPSVSVYGHCLDQRDYGLLVEFVKQAQRKGVESNNLTQIFIDSGGSRTRRPIVRGIHKPILAQGYVKTIGRHHEHFMYAPTFTFEFVIASLMPGSIYEEVTQEAPNQRTWAQILDGLTKVQPAPPAPQPSPVPKVETEIGHIGEDVKKGLEGLF